MKQGVVGIWDGHDASVALISQGRLVFALSEERLTREKRASGFPYKALAELGRFAQNEGIELCALAIAGASGRALQRVFDGIYARTSPHRNPTHWTGRAVARWENTLPSIPGLRTVEQQLATLAVLSRVKRVLTVPPKVALVSHHTAHAFSAMLLSGESSELVLTWDAYGEGISGTLRDRRRPKLPITTFPREESPAALYGAVTVGLGFREGDEGKVMGLAALGDPAPFRERLVSWLHPTGNGSWRLPHPPRSREIARLLHGISREDAAAGLQDVVEQWACRTVAPWLPANRKEGVRLLLAGGLFANILVNSRLAQLDNVSGVAVFPNMTDGGLSAGAAASLWYDMKFSLAHGDTMALGCLPLSPEDDKPEGFDSIQGVKTLHRSLARDLGAGKVVCLCRGREEFGPRALGMRSILFAATDPALGRRVNEALGREPFMPFGPILREERINDVLAQTLGDSDFSTMTLATKAAPDLHQRCPQAVHVDTTIRPQVVTHRCDPWLWDLLKTAEENTGEPCFINTSFNLHGEPIVHDGFGALKTFERSKLDVLYVEHFRREASHVD